jgi:ectoine hydroxylase-related dioxygenase (phytanoyl-CoA dioxygenase family)
MSEAIADSKSAHSGSSILASDSDPQKRKILDEIESLGLTEKLLELEVQGFAVIPGVLSEDRIERAKAAILRRAEKMAGRKIDPESATTEDFNGMQYQHYLVFDDPVFQEILLEPKPLALVQYLLGADCVLSSMGSHLRGPGGLPLAVHVDGMPDGCLSSVAMIANCNYALTPYTQDQGALMLFPGSQHKQRQPTPPENWMAGSETLPEIMAKQLPPEELDSLEWTAPAGGITMELQPGDAVVWHGNSWHGGWRREQAGTRINLAAYFCREFMTTQELRGDTRYPEVFERYANDPRFAQLMGENRFNGWRDEGPNLERVSLVQAKNAEKN